MNKSNDTFPWPLLVAVIVATLAVTAGVDKCRERAATAAKATAQLAVHVPDHTQADTPKAPRKITIAKAAAEAAPAADLYAWSDDSFTCAPVESTDEWLRATKEKMSSTLGARVEIVPRDKGIASTPRGDGANLVVTTNFTHGQDFCQAWADEEKAIAESKETGEAYLSARTQEPKETMAEPTINRIPEAAKDAGPWYMGVAALSDEGCQRIGTTPELFAYDLRSIGKSVELSEVSKNGRSLIVAKLDGGQLMFAKDLGLCEHMVHGMSVLLQRRARGLPE